LIVVLTVQRPVYCTSTIAVPLRLRMTVFCEPAQEFPIMLSWQFVKVPGQGYARRKQRY
jgi:hypothetical protein